MDGDPLDPIPYERAAHELWDKLASNAGLNLREHQLRAAEEQASGEEAERDERFEEIRQDARFRLWSLAYMMEVKAWLDEGGHWKRPTQSVLHDRLTKANDEPSGLFVDRQQVFAVMADRWPDEFGRVDQSATAGLDRKDRAPAKRGRPPRSGSYEADDAPLVVKMHHLLESRKARSVHEASMMVAERAAGGGSLESKARRLRDRYGLKFASGE